MDIMGLSFKRLGILLVVGSIIFPILVTFTLMHQNSIYDLFEGFSKINVLAGRAQNATTSTVLKQGAQNITVEAGGGKDQHITESVVDKVLGDKVQNDMPGTFQERAQTITISDIGPKNHSLEVQKNDPSLSTISIANDQFLDGLLVSTFDEASCLSRNFPYWKDQKHIETYESVLRNSKKNSSKELLPQFLILNLQHTHDGHNNFFHCDQSQGLLQKVPILILWSDQYFVPSLFMIPSFRQDLSKMFPQKDTVFHHLGRYLFHPSNEAWKLISRSYEAHLAKANERIGLQIRVFNTHKAPHQTIINEIIACTLRHKLLPELNAHKSTYSVKKRTSKAVLVASLYSEYGKKLRTMYTANASATGEVIKVYQPSHEERQKSNNDTHNIEAWTEIYLLSLCDVLITSPKSTFGYVAHGLGGLKPWILRRAYGETIPDPPCQRAKSMEPCFHYPPKYDCRANSTIDFTSHFHHIKHCEDVTSGLRLVNANR